MAFATFRLEVHPILIFLSSSFNQGPSHYAFALHAGCSKYEHS